MSRIGSIVLCATLALPLLLGGCAAPLAIQALSAPPGATGQSSPFSLDALSRQFDRMTKGQLAPAPQVAEARQ